jgi:hypothetical protein
MFEPVHTMTHFYDGPRRGVTSFGGVPHLYESRFSDLDIDKEDSFWLMPITPEVFELALEDWAIWCRWENAFKQGQVSKDTHPVLPDDTNRYSQLQLELNSKLILDESKSFCAVVAFRPCNPLEHYFLMAEWTPVSCLDYLDNRQDVNFY